MKQLLTFCLLNYFLFFLGNLFPLLNCLIYALHFLVTLTLLLCQIVISVIFFQGFLNLSWKRWKRVLFTRAVAIIPTFFVAFFNNMTDLSGMNDVLNAVMSLQLPFATIPTIAFTSNPQIMGEFVNGW